LFSESARRLRVPGPASPSVSYATTKFYLPAAFARFEIRSSKETGVRSMTVLDDKNVPIRAEELVAINQKRKTPPRFKKAISLKARLALFATDLRKAATALGSVANKNDLLEPIHRADAASHLSDWVNSPGLQPPK
jgi:hypothetical protein